MNDRKKNTKFQSVTFQMRKFRVGKFKLTYIILNVPPSVFSTEVPHSQNKKGNLCHFLS